MERDASIITGKDMGQSFLNVPVENSHNNLLGDDRCMVRRPRDVHDDAQC